MTRAGVLGSGAVGEALANGFLSIGYDVMRGTRDPQKLATWKSKAGPKASVGTFSETANYGDLLVLATKGSAAESVLKLAQANNLSGKIVIDTTNPIADEAPVKGVLKFFTDFNESLMERLQRAAPSAYFVKAFSSVGNALMVNPDFSGIKPTMFICGNNDQAKSTVSDILEKFGWETEDLGSVEAARAIEPLCILWCIPGFLHNQWSHAFKLLKK